MSDWQIGCASWLRSIVELTGRKYVRRRKRPFDQFSPVAAEIQQLESRALLSITYHGGALLPAVEAQSVYLGSDWQSTPALQTQITSLNQFATTIVQSSYMDMLTNAGYNVGRGSATTGAVDNISLTKGTGSPITDAQIQADLQSMISSRQLQAPDANRLYIVYVEPGVAIQLGQQNSVRNFLGYHGAFAGQTSGGQSIDIHYSVIAYPGSPNFTSSSQGFSSDLNDLTAVSSHELAEAVTDPNVGYKTGGWYNSVTGDEIGDPAEGHYATVGGFLVQDVVNQSGQIISPANSTPPPAPPPSPPPTPPPAPAVGTPTLTAKAQSSTSALLTWNAVSGSPQGSRIYETIGSQTTVTQVSASTTSFQVNGLTAGSKVSFKIEAYNATSIADSQVVSLTMPGTAAPLATPQVTATALSPTTALLSWNSISGAQNYSIYWLNGNQPVFLGTVGANVTSVEIVNLPPGRTAQFLVKAFNPSAFANSAWVSVTTPAYNHHYGWWW